MRCLALLLLMSVQMLWPVASFTQTARAAQLHILDPHARLDFNAFFPEPACNAALVGTIAPGDSVEISQKLEQFYADPAIANDPEGVRGKVTPLALCLSSPGGDLAEAVKLSEMFEGWNTVIEDGDTCASACAILFMRAQGALDLFDWPVPVETARRFLHHRAKLGFHAPDLVLPSCAGASLTPAQTARMYARALRSVRSVLVGDAGWLTGNGAAATNPTGPQQPGTQKPIACLDDDVAAAKPEKNSFVGYGRYLRQKLPLDIILAFLLTPPGEMYWVTTVEEALNWKIDVYGLPQPKVLSERMLETACMNAIYLGCQSASLNNACGVQNEQYDTKHVRALYGHAKSKLKLWPQSGKDSPVTVQAFRADHDPIEHPSPKGIPYPCTVRAVWHEDKLKRLDLQTFNGNLQDLVQPAFKVEAKYVNRMIRGLKSRTTFAPGSDRLWPLAMLPANTLLANLATAPWQDLETGGNFFDKPINW